MAKFQIKLDSIFGGISPTIYRGRKDQFAASLGIDPDLPIDPDSTASIKTGGVITPSSYTDFTSAALTGYVNWLMTCPQNENLYAYASSGRLLGYDTSFAETNIGTPTSGAGNGAAYYNNYFYLATPTDIARYGPLDNTPVIANNFWGTTLGFAILGNPAFPVMRGITYPNHPMHVHVDNKLYIGDFETATTSTSEGRGKIHWIRTNSGANEGSDDNGSAQNAFFLPPSYAPIAIASWGNDLAILAIPMHTAGVGTATLQGKAALFLWDAINAPSLPYRMIPLVDALATALLNHNGDLYIWSGSLNNGARLSKYLGGYRVQQIAFFEEGYSPPAGCVDGFGSRIAWGGATTWPEDSMSVYAYGYKNGNIPPALHNIVNLFNEIDTVATAGITALKYFQHASFIIPRLGIAWKNGAAVSENFGISRFVGSSADRCLWQSLTYTIGQPFRINKISLSFGEVIAADTVIVPAIRVDDDSATFTLTQVDNTNYVNTERRIVLRPAAYGLNNFNFRLTWTGANTVSVTLPILIEGETLEDATG